MTQSKYWCFTLNNYTNQDKTKIEHLFNEGKYTYCIYGEEVGEQGTPHLQGYIEFSRRKRMQYVKRLISQRIHLESRRGSAEQAAEYCRKEGASTEYGDISESNQGKRSDLDSAVQAIRDGSTIAELWENHTTTMVRFRGGLGVAMSYLAPVEEHKGYDLDSFNFHPLEMDLTKSIILWGDSGVRKTSYVISRWPRILMISHLDQLVNYCPTRHEGILFDDMDFRHLPRTSQIHIVDQAFDRHIHVRYQTALIPKNTLKIFTTNEREGDIFLQDNAIERRINKIEIL